MKLRTIKDRKEWQKGEVVLLRVDANVPLENGRVATAADFRLQRIKPTIDFLREKKARIVLISHLGRPQSRWSQVNGQWRLEKRDENDLGLEPIAERMSEILGMNVPLFSDPIGTQELFNRIRSYEAGDVIMLENIRYYVGEEKNDLNFARMLASLGNAYVNDGFGVCHRRAASTVAVTQFLDSYAGLLLEEEVCRLSEVRENPARPFAAIIGGAKISTKINLISYFLKQTDAVLLGGGLATTVLGSLGYQIGGSLCERDAFHEVSRILLNRYPAKLILPSDLVMRSKTTDSVRLVSVPKAPAKLCADDEEILDIGPASGELFGQNLVGKKLIVWNGTLGKTEDKRFRAGSQMVLKAVLAQEGANTIVGGGETVMFVREEQAEDKFSFLSTGGGAMLEFLEGKELPGITVLQQ